MKKEKTVKAHTRKTKSGKTVTVKQHTAKYDATDQAKDIVRKAGAGVELEKVKKSKMQEDPYRDFDFTAEEFAEWYEGTGSKADKKVEKALRKALGRKAYDELNDAAAEGYKKGGAAKFFSKEVSVAKPTAKETPAKSSKEATPKAKKVKEEIPTGKEKVPKSKGKKKEEFSSVEKDMALMVYDLSGEDNNLPPKLAAWAKKEAQRQDRERAKKADVGVLKELDTKVIGKLEALQKKGPNLTKREEKYIEDHVDEHGIIIGTKVRAFEAINAYRKAQKTGTSTRAEEMAKVGSKKKGNQLEAPNKSSRSKPRESSGYKVSPEEFKKMSSKQQAKYFQKTLEERTPAGLGPHAVGKWRNKEAAKFRKYYGIDKEGNPIESKGKTPKKKKNTPEEDAALDATLAEIRERNKQPYQVSRKP